MRKQIKDLLRVFLPKSFRGFLWRIIPKFHKTNTYIQNNPVQFKTLKKISDKYIVREVGQDDLVQLKKANAPRGKNAFKTKVLNRMHAREWVGLAVFDTTNGNIAYIAWIIIQSIPYFEEFGVYLKEYQYLLKDGYCVPEYRHQGLHTRMEQERINYCVKRGATDIFIQIDNANKKGINSVLENGYKLYQQDTVIQWPVFGIFRSFKGFLINPFRKVIK